MKWLVILSSFFMGCTTHIKEKGLNDITTVKGKTHLINENKGYLTWFEHPDTGDTVYVMRSSSGGSVAIAVVPKVSKAASNETATP